jgi:glutamate formiminotransferase
MLVESVPNISEGRRLDVVDALAHAIRSSPGARLLDYSADAAHNRSVFTFAGTPQAVERAVLALFETAVAAIDLREHRGEHPRLGAVDVVPFIPLDGATMADAVALARRVGAAVAERFRMPVFLYEAAAATPQRANLENVRRGQFEGLAARLRSPDWAPDFGPAEPHATAGATIVGARRALVAYNINLNTSKLEVAKRIAAAVRESSGGLQAVKAMGVTLADRGLVQVSINLTDYTQTPIQRVFDAVAREAERLGVEIAESQLVGLIPKAALAGTTPEHLRLKNFREDRILENRLISTP